MEVGKNVVILGRIPVYWIPEKTLGFDTVKPKKHIDILVTGGPVLAKYR